MISPYIYKRFCVKDLGLKLNDQEVEDMIAMADMDGDGKIQYNEFVTVMFNKKNWIVIQHLTDDAWVSGPDLAPQKFLLSQ